MICTKNTRVRMLDDAGTTVTLERFSNGSQFKLINDYTSPTDNITVDRELDLGRDPELRLAAVERFLVLDDFCGKEYTVVYRDIVGKAKLKIAWALTVHKFQGMLKLFNSVNYLHIITLTNHWLCLFIELVSFSI